MDHRKHPAPVQLTAVAELADLSGGEGELGFIEGEFGR